MSEDLKVIDYDTAAELLDLVSRQRFVREEPISLPFLD